MFYQNSSLKYCIIKPIFSYSVCLPLSYLHKFVVEDMKTSRRKTSGRRLVIEESSAGNEGDGKDILIIPFSILSNRKLLPASTSIVKLPKAFKRICHFSKRV